MKRSAIVIAAFLSLYACHKGSTTEHNTQPYPLSVPSYVTDYEGPIHDEENITVAKVELGKKLFFSPLLSEDLSMSCASCHDQKAGFSDPKQFSVGTQGESGNRNAMSVAYLGWDSEFFWDGRAFNLAHQALGPVLNEIELNTTWDVVVDRVAEDKELLEAYQRAYGYTFISEVELVQAIAAYESTIMAFDAPYDRWFYGGDQSAISESAMRGFMIYFDKAECVHCHGGPLLTDHTFKNNGLDSVFTDIGYMEVTNSSLDRGKFKVPSLRNISLTAPYMHDGRFASLEEVIEHYNSGVKESATLDPDMHVFEGGLGLTQQEKDDLLAFLLMFTDSSIIDNPAYFDPY